MKKTIVKIMLSLFRKRQQQQCFRDTEMLGNTYKLYDYRELSHINKSWWVVVGGIAFILTLSGGLQYDILRFKKCIFYKAGIENE